MNETLVLLYHGVTNSKRRQSSLRNYNSKHLYIKTFEEQISYVKKNFNVIPLNEFVKNWGNNEISTKKNVVITFDDGFKNNFDIAAPILEKYETPATFYISTGNVTDRELFWVDLLEIAFDETPKTKISINEIPTIFKLTFPLLKNETNFNLYLKIQALDLIKKKLKIISPDKRTNLIKGICEELEINHIQKMSSKHYDYSTMTWNDIKKLVKKDLFTIGGHSHFHNILTTLNNKELNSEIIKSISLLKENLGEFSGHYAYPEGQKNHYDERSKNVLKENGVIACPSAIMGYANPIYQDLFDFKRVMIGIDQKSNYYLYNY